METKEIKIEKTIFTKEVNNCCTYYVDLIQLIDITDTENPVVKRSIFHVCRDEKTIKTFQIGEQAINYVLNIIKTN
jgi:hypothetical protein